MCKHIWSKFTRVFTRACSDVYMFIRDKCEFHNSCSVPASLELFVLFLCSSLCPLGSVAGWVFTGDRAHLWLISGVYEAASNEHQRPIVTLPSGWYQTSLFSLFLRSLTFPAKRLRSGLWTLCSGAPREEFLDLSVFLLSKYFPSVRAFSVFPIVRPIKSCFFVL